MTTMMTTRTPPLRRSAAAVRAVAPQLDRQVRPFMTTEPS